MHGHARPRPVIGIGFILFFFLVWFEATSHLIYTTILSSLVSWPCRIIISCQLYKWSFLTKPHCCARFVLEYCDVILGVLRNSLYCVRNRELRTFYSSVHRNRVHSQCFHKTEYVCTCINLTSPETEHVFLWIHWHSVVRTIRAKQSFAI